MPVGKRRAQGCLLHLGASAPVFEGCCPWTIEGKTAVGLASCLHLLAAVVCGGLSMEGVLCQLLRCRLCPHSVLSSCGCALLSFPSRGAA